MPGNLDRNGFCALPLVGGPRRPKTFPQESLGAREKNSDPRVRSPIVESPDDDLIAVALAEARRAGVPEVEIERLRTEEGELADAFTAPILAARLHRAALARRRILSRQSM